MSRTRLLLVGGAAITIAIGAAAFYFVTSLDGIVARAIEKHGSDVTGVPVRVRSVSIQLRSGRGTIRGLSVGNPAGFSSNDAFELGEITLDIDPASFTSSPIVIEQLRVASTEVHFEMDGRGRSNFDVIRSQVEARSGGGKKDSASASEGEERLLTIRRFEFDRGEVSADITALDPDVKSTSVPLPEMTLRNVGGKSGATPAVVGEEVVGAFLKSVTRAVAASQAAREIEKRIGGEAGRAAGSLLKKFLE